MHLPCLAVPSYDLPTNEPELALFVDDYRELLRRLEGSKLALTVAIGSGGHGRVVAIGELRRVATRFDVIEVGRDTVVTLPLDEFERGRLTTFDGTSDFLLEAEFAGGVVVKLSDLNALVDYESECGF